MEDIELVVKIPKEEYDLIVNDEACGLNVLTRAIANGKKLPKGHGDLKDVKDILNKINLNYNNHQLIDAESLKDMIVTTSTIIEADKEQE